MITAGNEYDRRDLGETKFLSSQEHIVAQKYVGAVVARVGQLMIITAPAIHDQIIGLIPTEFRGIGKLTKMFCLDLNLDQGVSKMISIERESGRGSCIVETHRKGHWLSSSLFFNPPLSLLPSAVVSNIETIEIDHWLRQPESGPCRPLSLIRVMTDDGGIFNAAIQINDQQGKEDRFELTLAVIGNPFGDNKLYSRDSLKGLIDGKTGKILS